MATATVAVGAGSATVRGAVGATVAGAVAGVGVHEATLSTHV